MRERVEEEEYGELKEEIKKEIYEELKKRVEIREEEMQKKVEKEIKEREEEIQEQAEKRMMPEMGIGISYGTPMPILMGKKNKGNEDIFIAGIEGKSEYTVIGREVNISSRLCGKAPGKGIFVSEACIEKYKQEIQEEGMPDDILDKFEKIEPIPVKGIEKPVEVYRYKDDKKWTKTEQ